MGEWSRYEVRQLIEDGKLVIGDGYRAKNEELSSYGLPFARAGNINDGFRFQGVDCFPKENLSRVGNKVSKPGDVVFTSKGTVGRFAFVRENTPEFVYSPQLCFWRSLDYKVIDSRFLYYWMAGPEFFIQFKGVSGQTDMAEYVSLADQRRMYITLPSVGQQRTIASLLGSLDDKIALNRHMNETLEATARLLFKDWFVDFGPTRAKAEGHMPYLALDLWSLFPAALDDEDKPVGWTSGTLSNLATLNPESWTAQTAPSQIEYVDLSNTKWGEIEQTQKFTWDQAPSRAQRILQPGDTIVGTVRPGNGSYALVSAKGLTGSTGFAVLRPRLPEYREIIHLAATSRDTIEALTHLADGAAYPAVRPDVVAARELVIPDGQCLAAFSATVAPIINQVEANKAENVAPRPTPRLAFA